MRIITLAQLYERVQERRRQERERRREELETRRKKWETVADFEVFDLLGGNP